MSISKSGLAALLLVGLLAACGGSPSKESTGEYIDDTAITAKVKAANIKVETFKGRVQLSGFADSRAEIDRAVRTASQVPGVKAVTNDIRLKQ